MPNLELQALFKQGSFSLQSLYLHNLQRVEFTEEEDDKDTTVWRCSITLPETVSYRDENFNSLHMQFSIIGQISLHRPSLRRRRILTTSPHGPPGSTVTSIRFWLEPRRDPAAMVEWQREVATLRRIADWAGVRLNVGKVFSDGTSNAKIRFRGSHLSLSGPSETRGFPVENAAGARITLTNVLEIPHGVAVRVLFGLEYGEQATPGGAHPLRTTITYIRLA